MSLDGKRIVIIGGSSGIGLSIAKAVSIEGAEVIIASRNKEKLHKAKEVVRHSNTKCLDIRNKNQIKKFFNKIANFDHLITPGSASSPGSCLELSEELARDSFESKFWGQYYAVKYGSQHLNKNGSIVLFSGVLSQRPIPNTAIMSAVNSAVEGLTRALAIELAPIRVNCISPGYINSPRFANMSEEDRASLFANVGKNLPIGRVGKPEEIAQTAIYLMKNGYTTSSTLYVDGGYSMR